MDMQRLLREQVQGNPVMLYMKGTPDAPRCGFSQQVVAAMVACGERFAFVDVLQEPEVRRALPEFADWPTFPQLWVGGELVGGCDIVTDMHARDELRPLLRDANERGGSRHA